MVTTDAREVISPEEAPIPNAFRQAVEKAAERDEVIHQWIYVIVPVQKYNSADLVFSAFCKGCRKYFSEKIDYVSDQSTISQSHLPRYGCHPQEG